jgi:hypothetical protein
MMPDDYNNTDEEERTTFLDTMDSLVMFRQGPATKDVQPFRSNLEIVDPPVFPMWINPAVLCDDSCGGIVFL